MTDCIVCMHKLCMNVLHYYVDCRETWMRYTDTYVSGTQSLLINDSEECLKECVRNKACVASCMNTSPFQCYSIKNSAALESATARTGYNLYELKNRCDAQNQGLYVI